jgi:hypothetical protein
MTPSHKSQGTRHKQSCQMPSGRQKSGRRALLRSLAGYAGRLGQLQQCQYHTIMPHVGAHDVRSQAMTHQRVVVHSDGEEGEGRPHVGCPAAPARPYTTTGISSTWLFKLTRGYIGVFMLLPLFLGTAGTNSLLSLHLTSARGSNQHKTVS